MKPNFMVAGVAKCGTTSLSNYLEQHPQVCIPKKETFFFIREIYETLPSNPIGQRKQDQIVRTPEAYAHLYSTCNKPFLGEVSTCYLYYHKHAIPRIKEQLGDIPIAIIIRNPIKRAISGYRHFVRLERENLSFEEALKAEGERKKHHWDFMWQYRELGLYAEGIKAFQDNFSQVKVITQEDLTANSVQIMKELYRFYGMDDNFVPDTTVRYNISDPQYSNPWFKYVFNNSVAKKILKPIASVFLDNKQRRKLIHSLRRPSETPQRHVEISDGLIKELKEYYRADILLTQQLTGLNLEHWTH